MDYANNTFVQAGHDSAHAEVKRRLSIGFSGNQIEPWVTQKSIEWM